MYGSGSGNYQNPYDMDGVFTTPNTASLLDPHTMPGPSATSQDQLFGGVDCPSRFAFSRYLSSPGFPTAPMDGTSAHPPASLLERPSGNNSREIRDAMYMFNAWNSTLTPALQRLTQLFRDYAIRTLFFNGRPDWSAPAKAFIQFGDVLVILQGWWARDNIPGPFPLRPCLGERHAFIHLRA